MQLGKVAVERPQVAALDVDVGRAAEDDRAEAVPFRLVEEVAAVGSSSASFASIGSIGGGRGKEPASGGVLMTSSFRSQADDGLLSVMPHCARQSRRSLIDALSNGTLEPIGVVDDEKSPGSDPGQEALDLGPDDIGIVAAVQVHQAEAVETEPSAAAPEVQVSKLLQKQLGIHHVVHMIGVRRERLSSSRDSAGHRIGMVPRHREASRRDPR